MRNGIEVIPIRDEEVKSIDKYRSDERHMARQRVFQRPADEGGEE